MASKRRLRRRECSGKAPYTYEEARTAARQLQRRGQGKLMAYKCPWGNHWHVGHPPKWKRQSIRDIQRERKRKS